MSDLKSGANAQLITVSACTPLIGAEVAGLDLSKDLSPRALATIVEALHKWGVVFFRSQVLTEAQHIAFSRHFDELELHVLKQYTHPEHPEILILSNIVNDGIPVGLADGGTGWHSDTSYLSFPDRASILYAREIPVPNANGNSAGDTMFASAQAAYEALEQSMKDRLAGLQAVYSYVTFYDRKIKAGSKRAPLTEERKRTVPDVIHPLIRTHPFTGKKSIYVNPNHTAGIVGMPEKEAGELLKFLFKHVTRPEFVYRHKWKVGDVLMWDNCVVQHNAVGDYALPQRRLMHRTTIKGTAPF